MSENTAEANEHEVHRGSGVGTPRALEHAARELNRAACSLKEWAVYHLDKPHHLEERTAALGRVDEMRGLSRHLLAIAHDWHAGKRF